MLIGRASSRMEGPFKIRINGELRGTPRVQVVASNGEMLGAMTLAEALRLAMKEGLDLVEVNPTVEPPICKILDFSKFKYEEKRKAAEAKRRSRIEDDSDELLTFGQPVTWTPFECDRRPFEYRAMQGKEQTRPAGWPANKPAPDPWVPVVFVIVRNPGQGSGSGMTFPAGTVVTTEHAIEAARALWATLTE
jgi:hypothetical protein